MNPLRKLFQQQPQPTAAPTVDSEYGTAEDQEAVRISFTNAKTQEDIEKTFVFLIDKEKKARLERAENGNGVMAITCGIVRLIFKDFNTAIDQNDIELANKISETLKRDDYGEITIKFGIRIAVERVLKDMIGEVKREIANKANQKAVQQALGGVSLAGDVLGDIARGAQDLEDQHAVERLREKQTKFIANSTTINDLIRNLKYLSSINTVGGQVNQFFISEATKIQAIWDNIKYKIPEGVGYSPQAVDACIQTVIYIDRPGGSISNEYGIRDTLLNIIRNIGNSHKVDLDLS